MIPSEYRSDSIKIFSFDVFDTVITRNVLQPKGIFSIMRKQLLSSQQFIGSSFVDKFETYRIEAEKEARCNTLFGEVTLEEIYHFLALRFQLSNSTTHYLQLLEIQTELDSVRIIPRSLNLISELRRLGKRIVFVSDMYLPQKVVESMLIPFGAFREGDGLYLSSEFTVTKETGKLFQIVMDREACAPYQILHTGDNWVSDFTSPRALGIHAIHFITGGVNRFETSLLLEPSALNPGSDHVGQLIAGMTKLARLAVVQNSSRCDSLYRIGANIAGPILVSFVSWVLAEARKLGLHRLYFLSRDGQILLEIAQKLTCCHWPELELKYLYGSRQSWHLPAIFEITDRELEWIFEVDPILTLNILSKRTCVNLALLQESLFNRSKKFLDGDVPLGKEDLDHLYSAVSDELRSEILAQAALSRETTLCYFRQVGLFDSTDFGIIDLGWQGRMQDSLWMILHHGSFSSNIHGFYFGLSKKVPDNLSGSCKRAFFFYPGCGEPYWSIGRRFGNIMEIFTAADHGMTTNYILDKDRGCRPGLTSDSNQNVIAWGLNDLRFGIKAFVDCLIQENVEEVNLADNMQRDRLTRLMTVFLMHPEKDLAEAIGSYPFSSDQAETYFRPFAPPFSTIQALKYSLSSGWRRKLSYTYWIEGTRAYSPMFSRIILSSSIQYVIYMIQNIVRCICGKE